jgi:PqqD family protein of HPr-rel-A system
VTPPVRLSLAPEASVAELDGEAVVLHLRTGRFFTVNRSGAPLLEALKRADGATRDELVASLVATFRIDVARAAADVDAWLGRLRAAGLLAEDAAGPSS